MLGGSACGCFPVGVANTTEYPFSSKQLNGPTSSSPQYPNSDRTTKIRLAISTPRVPRRVRRPCDLTRTTAGTVTMTTKSWDGTHLPSTVLTDRANRAGNGLRVFVKSVRRLSKLIDQRKCGR